MAFPFLSVLAYSERYAAEQGKQHKKLTGWACQILVLARPWWPERQLVVVTDSTYACFRLLVRYQRFLPNLVTFVTHLRLDAVLSRPRYPVLVRWEVLVHRRMTQREETIRRAA